MADFGAFGEIVRSQRGLWERENDKNESLKTVHLVTKALFGNLIII
jgi:hypothetical protein